MPFCALFCPAQNRPKIDDQIGGLSVALVDGRIQGRVWGAVWRYPVVLLSPENIQLGIDMARLVTGALAGEVVAVQLMQVGWNPVQSIS